MGTKLCQQNYAESKQIESRSQKPSQKQLGFTMDLVDLHMWRHWYLHIQRTMD